MTRTEYIRNVTGDTLYCKPRPLQTGTWGADTVVAAENGTTGEYSFSGLNDYNEYEVFRQAGGSPASTDIAIGQFDRLLDFTQVLGDVGDGSEDFPVQITGNTVPLVGAKVWVTSDVEGQIFVAGLVTTDLSGQVTFKLNPGTYFLWAQYAGVAFANPLTIVVPSP